MKRNHQSYIMNYASCFKPKHRVAIMLTFMTSSNVVLSALKLPKSDVNLAIKSFGVLKTVT